MTVVRPTTLETGGRLPSVSDGGVRAQLARGLVRDRTALLGLVLVGALSAAALLAPLLAPHDPNAIDVANKFAPSSRHFLLGSDHLGRDVLSRLLWGARVSIASTLVASAGITAIGVVVGLLAGYFGGFLDMLVGRVIDVLLAFPALLLALAVTGVLGASLRNIIISVVAVSWARYARILRSAVLSEARKPYVEAARAAGGSSVHILRRHILPNVVAPIVVLTTLDLGGVLLTLSAFSFLGLGIRPPTAEWGAMLSEGRTYLSRSPNEMLFPGIAIVLMVLGFNLLGDGLRDQLDPRTRNAGA